MTIPRTSNTQISCSDLIRDLLSVGERSGRGQTLPSFPHLQNQDDIQRAAEIIVYNADRHELVVRDPNLRLSTPEPIEDEQSPDNHSSASSWPDSVAMAKPYPGSASPGEGTDDASASASGSGSSLEDSASPPNASLSSAMDLYGLPDVSSNNPMISPSTLPTCMDPFAVWSNSPSGHDGHE